MGIFYDGIYDSVTSNKLDFYWWGSLSANGLFAKVEYA